MAIKWPREGDYDWDDVAWLRATAELLKEEVERLGAENEALKAQVKHLLSKDLPNGYEVKI